MECVTMCHFFAQARGRGGTAAKPEYVKEAQNGDLPSPRLRRHQMHWDDWLDDWLDIGLIWFDNLDD